MALAEGEPTEVAPAIEGRVASMVVRLGDEVAVGSSHGRPGRAASSWASGAGRAFVTAGG